MINYANTNFGNGLKIRDIVSCTSNFEYRFGGLFEAWAHVNKPRGVLYRGVELASSFLGLHKLTYLLWLRPQAKIRSFFK